MLIINETETNENYVVIYVCLGVYVCSITCGYVRVEKEYYTRLVYRLKTFHFFRVRVWFLITQLAHNSVAKMFFHVSPYSYIA